MPLIKSSEKISVTFTLNGIKLSKNIYPRTLLSDFLRYSIGETGTHVGCEHGIYFSRLRLGGQPLGEPGRHVSAVG